MKAVWRVVAIVLMMGLAGCSTISPDPAASPSPPMVRPPPPRPAPPPTASPAIPPERLTGLNRDETRILLGRATRETASAMGTVWHYRKGECVLSLVFYPEVESGIERVLSYEFTGGKDTGICRKRFLEGTASNGK